MPRASRTVSRPCFRRKGRRGGGGYAQVVPMEDINLHFTGDMHAITAANNLIAAMVDNSIQQGNPCNIDPRRVTWKRCMDMNDRQLRNILDGLGGKPNGTPREDGFDITTASEIMATLCLASSIADLKARIARIVVARTYDDKPVTAGDIHARARRRRCSKTPSARTSCKRSSARPRSFTAARSPTSRTAATR